MMSWICTHRWGRLKRLGRLLTVGLLVSIVPLLTIGGSAGAQSAGAQITDSQPSSDPARLLGSQGTDVALPDTDSAVSVVGVGRYHKMAFHVSKTKALTNEAVSVSWTGGAPGAVNGPVESTNFVQIMQCWGDPVTAADGTVGPPPEQCVFGADPDGQRVNATNSGFEFIRAKMPAIEDWVPFKAADGTVVAQDTGPNPNDPSSSIWLNPFYTRFSSNEITSQRNSFDGSGAAFFETQTGLQNAGLGCGQKFANGTHPKCWLVFVPRGEHDDVPGVDDRGQAATTPLDGRGPWKNRVAIPLNFTPVASGCAISNAQQSISGADLTLPAMDRWLPRLCAEAGAPPYIYTRTPDDRARTLLAQRVNGGSGDGMIVTAAPLDTTTLPVGRIPVYAPIDVSAVVVGFDIQRHNLLDGLPDATQKAFAKYQSSYVEHIKLTPRLVAKLLTQSYLSYFQPGTAFLATAAAKNAYAWTVNNPKTMLFDPDFQALNPEFTVLGPISTESATTLEVSLGSSAAATAVWNWIKADPAAMRWLFGIPDPYGMRVNPYFSTDASKNPNHASFAVPPSGGFPKNDPLSWITPDAAQVKLPTLSLNNEWPFQDSLTSTARVTRTGNRGARINYDANSPFGYTPSGTQPLGARAMLSITDAADAQRFGIQAAALQNANGDFVEPTVDGLSRGVAVMPPDPKSGMLRTDFSAKAEGAYPLTTVDYAASVPSVLTGKERSDYSRFLDYVAGPGQVSGEGLGQLPRGYLPLPAALRAKTLAAARQVAGGEPLFPVQPVVTTSPPPTAAPSTSAPTTTQARSTSLTNTVPATSLPPTASATPTSPPSFADSPVSSPSQSGASAPTIAAAPGASSSKTTPSKAKPARPIEPSNPRPASGTSSSAADAQTSAPTNVRLAAATTGADPPGTPWVAFIFLIGVLAAVAVPVVGRAHARRRT